MYTRTKRRVRSSALERKNRNDHRIYHTRIAAEILTVHCGRVLMYVYVHIVGHYIYTAACDNNIIVAPTVVRPAIIYYIYICVLCGMKWEFFTVRLRSAYNSVKWKIAEIRRTKNRKVIAKLISVLVIRAHIFLSDASLTRLAQWDTSCILYMYMGTYYL